MCLQIQTAMQETLPDGWSFIATEEEVAQEEKIYKLLDSGQCPGPVDQEPRKKSETDSWEVEGCM